MDKELKKLIEFITLEDVLYKLDAIDQAIQYYNIGHGHQIDKFVSLDVCTSDTWIVKFYGQAKDLYFRKYDSEGYYIRVKSPSDESLEIETKPA